MTRLQVVHASSEFECMAELTESKSLTEACAHSVQEKLDRNGFVIIKNLLTDAEAAVGLELVCSTLGDSQREFSTFASYTDTQHGRRDFCPLPLSAPVKDFSSQLIKRIWPVLGEYCGSSRQVLEISTLTSRMGSSHQFLHRDPPGIISILVAVSDISEAQGGTIFVPGTHFYSGSRRAHSGKNESLSAAYALYVNLHTFFYNVRTILRLRFQGNLSWRELWDRLFSLKKKDHHQPTWYKFLGLLYYGRRHLLSALFQRAKLARLFTRVQLSPSAGTVVMYRSDILHCGPDNRSDTPRHFISVNISRDVIHEDEWSSGYTAHSTLKKSPQNVADFLK
jgi:ectoine hydroxylase-related dioxygenase (phytanoyl-CoA dioxygenase family)